MQLEQNLEIFNILNLNIKGTLYKNYQASEIQSINSEKLVEYSYLTRFRIII
jgi:hypothetical protein